MKTKSSKAEKMINMILTFFLIAVVLAGCVVAAMYPTPEVFVAIGIMSLVSLFGIAAIWIVTTIELANPKNSDARD